MGKIRKKTLLVTLWSVISLSVPPGSAGGTTVEMLALDVPVLTHKEYSPVLHFRVVGNGDKPWCLNEIKVSLKGSSLPGKGVRSASLFTGTRKDQYGRKDPGRMLSVAQPAGRTIHFSPGYKAMSDTIECWVTVNLDKSAFSPKAKLVVSALEVKASDGMAIPVNFVPVIRRIGVAVRNPGQDGIHTSRIPGLETTSKGTLIALYDARNERDDDLQGDIDIVINRSTDGGRTWGPVIKSIDMGEYGGLPERYNGVSDGSVLYDPKEDVVYATGLWMHGILDPKDGKWVENLTDTSTVWNHQWRSCGSQPGYDIKRSSQFLISKSHDDGQTWSEPVNITRQVKDSVHWLLAPAPGRGIVMKDGTLVFPAEGRDSTGGAYSTIIYSRDQGKTWTCGAPATFNTNECQVVELSDGSLMLNARHRANRRLKTGNGRAIAVTKDMGKTWTEHQTSRKALVEPACQGSLYRHDYKRNGTEKHVLLFSNPSDTDRRIRHTIKVSFDDGETWPEEYWMLLDGEWGAGYSCMTSIDNETIGIFYEGSQADIQFQAIPLADLLKDRY